MLVNGDGELLAQALGNLLDNAIDFTPQGGEIALAAEKRNEEVQLSVIDNGCGIPDYALERIFERFYSLPISICTIGPKAAWSPRCDFTVPSHSFKFSPHSRPIVRPSR